MSTSRNILHPGLTLREINVLEDKDARSMDNDTPDEDEDVRVPGWKGLLPALAQATSVNAPVACLATQEPKPFPFEKLPGSIQAKIFRLWLVCYFSKVPVKLSYMQTEKADVVCRPRRVS